MTDVADMSAPVTRGELREQLEQLDSRFDQKLERLEARVDQKFELWGGALRAEIRSGEQRMIAELGRHAKAIQEALSIQISVIDEKYKDLPGRVSRLEATLLPTEQR